MDVARRGLRRGSGARPGRRALVIPDLDELVGPTSGTVELPLRLLWLPNRRLDLDNIELLKFMYQQVLDSAVTADELRAWLHGPTLIRLWSTLGLPRGLRQAWEDRHPQLRTLAVAA